MLPPPAAIVPAPASPPVTAAAAPPASINPGAAANPVPGITAAGTNSGGSNSGANAAGSDNNQAVATTSANAPQPAHGANSFSKGEAQRRIAKRGFQNVSDLRKDGMGVWRGTATKNGQQIQIWLDYKGNVGQQ